MNEEREDGERGEREGEGTQGLSLSSGTHRIHNSLTEWGTHATLLTDTRRRVVSLVENTDRIPGVEL